MFHLGVDPESVIECVMNSDSEKDLNIKLKRFSRKLKYPLYMNLKVVQMGMSDMALEKLEEVKDDLGARQRGFTLFA